MIYPGFAALTFCRKNDRQRRGRYGERSGSSNSAANRRRYYTRRCEFAGSHPQTLMARILQDLTGLYMETLYSTRQGIGRSEQHRESCHQKYKSR